MRFQSQSGLVFSTALATLAVAGCSTSSGGSSSSVPDASADSAAFDGAPADARMPADGPLDAAAVREAAMGEDSGDAATEDDASDGAAALPDAARNDAGCLIDCAAHPSACGYPDETNTGVPPSMTLTASGYLNVTKDGTTLNGLDITGGVNIQASNVTIKNCRLTGGAEAYFLVSIRQGSMNTLIEDSTIAGLDDSTNGLSVGIFDISGAGSGTTLRRLNMYNCAECINGQPTTVEDNYIHDLAFWASDAGPTHNEDVYLPCPDGPITMSHNTFFNQVDQTATVYVDSYGGACSNTTISDNLLAGGGWTFYVPQAGTAFSFTNNRFSRLYFPSSGGYGPIAGCSGSGCGSPKVTGNIWDETCAAVE